MKNDLTSTDSNWNANTCGKYGNSPQHSYAISHGNSSREPVSGTPQGSYESISQYLISLILRLEHLEVIQV